MLISLYRRKVEVLLKSQKIRRLGFGNGYTKFYQPIIATNFNFSVVSSNDCFSDSKPQSVMVIFAVSGIVHTIKSVKQAFLLFRGMRFLNLSQKRMTEVRLFCQFDDNVVSVLTVSNSIINKNRDKQFELMLSLSTQRSGSISALMESPFRRQRSQKATLLRWLNG